MKQVIARYELAVEKQTRRRDRQGRDFFTKDEQAALAHYDKALTQLRALEAQ